MYCTVYLEFVHVLKALAISVEHANKVYVTVGLLLSEKKTKVMTCNVAPDPILTNGGIALEEVEDFKYLGSWVNSSERDIKTRKALAWKALNSMKRV